MTCKHTTWNDAPDARRQVGINDKLFYMFGDAVIGPAVGLFTKTH
jgi:hypothetical protein